MCIYYLLGVQSSCTGDGGDGRAWDAKVWVCVVSCWRVWGGRRGSTAGVCILTVLIVGHVKNSCNWYGVDRSDPLLVDASLTSRMEEKEDGVVSSPCQVRAFPDLEWCPGVVVDLACGVT